MTDPTARPPAPPSTPLTGSSAGGAWWTLRPFAVLALLVVALGAPLDAAWQQGLVAAAVAGILVCAWPLLREPWGTPGSAVLVVGAVLGLLGPIAYANPWSGVDAREWPWAFWLESRRWVGRIDVLLWGIAPLLALVAAARRGRASAVAALTVAVLLAARGFAERGAMTLVQMERVNLIWTLAAGSLGGALIHLSGASSRGRGAARAIVVLAVAVIASVYLSWFPQQGGGERASLQYYIDELPPIFGAAFRGAETEERFRTAMTQQTWYVGIPFLLQALAVALALLVAAVPSRHRPRPVRWLAAVALLAFVATWLVPTRASFWFHRDVAEGLRATRYAQAVGETLMKAGLAVFLLLAGSVAAVLGRGAGGPEPAAVVPGSGRALRWTYVGAAALAAFVLWAAVRPDGGLEVTGTLAGILARGQWDVPTARVVYRGALVVAGLLAAVAPAGAARGSFVVAAAAMALTALTPSVTRWLGGVETYVVPAAAAVAAAAAIRSDRYGSRLTAIAAALLVTALLLYPQAIPTTMRPDGSASVPYRSALVDDTVRALVDADDQHAFLRILVVPGRLATIGFALTAAATFLAVALRSRRVGLGAAVAFLALTVVAPTVSQVLGGGGGGGVDTVSVAMGRTAEAWLEWSVPTIVLLFAGVLDLVRGRDRLPAPEGGRAPDGGAPSGPFQGA